MMMSVTGLDSLTKKPLILTRRLCLVVAAIMTAASLSGTIFPDLVYPDQILRDTFLANDLVNLIIGLPLFIFGLVLIRKKRPLGLFLLPGALVYVIYNYLAYLVARPLSIFTLINLALVLSAGYALIDLLTSLDHQAIKARLDGYIPRKFSAWILIIMGGAFFLLALYQNINSILMNAPLSLGEQATSLADLMVSSLWMGGGILLLRNQGLGYTTGLGLLTAVSSLFIGLILFFLLNPLITGQPFLLNDLLIVFGMGFITYIPLFLYIRGIIRSK